MSQHLFDRVAQDSFRANVRLITAAGVQLPAEVIELQKRAQVLDRIGTTHFRDRAVAAIVDGDTDADLPMLLALAAIEGSPGRLDAFDAVRAELQRKIRWTFGQHAIAIYDEMSSMFDQAAEEFTAAAGIYDPEIRAEAVVSATDEQRQAWKDALVLSRRLEGMLPALRAAAVLLGFQVGPATNLDGTRLFGGPDRPDDRDLLLPLSVDTTGLHRRKVWDAWEIEERRAEAEAQAAQGFSVTVSPPLRTGRWGALVKLGAVIRACPLDRFEPYRRPRQMEQRKENLPGGPRTYWVDPEDADYKPHKPALSHAAT